MYRFRGKVIFESLLLIPLLAFLISHKYVTEWTPLSSSLISRGFEKIAQQEGVTVFQDSSSDIIRLAAETTLPVAADRIERILLDYGNQAGKIPRVVESKILDRGPSWMIIYQRLHLPVINDRDFTLFVTWGKDGDLSWIVFKAIKDRGPPPQKGVVRVYQYQGSWQLKPIVTGKSTFMRYQMSMDLASWLPKWMTRSQSGNDVIELFRVIRAMMVSPEYRSRSTP